MLATDGVLVFKWNETQVKVTEVLTPVVAAVPVTRPANGTHTLAGHAAQHRLTAPPLALVFRETKRRRVEWSIGDAWRR